MATASKDTVKKTVETTVDEEVIQLTLTNVEARALYALVNKVWNGDGSDTYGRETSAVKAALYGTGKLGYVPSFEYFYVDSDKDVRAKSHSFNDQ